MATKLRDHESFGFRAETKAQEDFILAAQRAAGLKMSDLLRRAVMRGIPAIVAEAKAAQAEAFTTFEAKLAEDITADAAHPRTNGVPSSKRGKKVA
jgi:hypothetical protein